MFTFTFLTITSFPATHGSTLGLVYTRSFWVLEIVENDPNTRTQSMSPLPFGYFCTTLPTGKAYSVNQALRTSLGRKMPEKGLNHLINAFANQLLLAL